MKQFNQMTLGDIINGVVQLERTRKEYLAMKQYYLDTHGVYAKEYYKKISSVYSKMLADEKLEGKQNLLLSMVLDGSVSLEIDELDGFNEIDGTRVPFTYNSLYLKNTSVNDSEKVITWKIS